MNDLVKNLLLWALVAVVLMLVVTFLLIRYLRRAIRRLKSWFGAQEPDIQVP